MKKSLIIIVGALCIVAASATMAAAATWAPKSAARSTMAGAVAASSGFPTTCPPAAVVGKALGLTLSKPVVTKESGTPFSASGVPVQRHPGDRRERLLALDPCSDLLSLSHRQTTRCRRPTMSIRRKLVPQHADSVRVRVRALEYAANFPKRRPPRSETPNFLLHFW